MQKEIVIAYFVVLNIYSMLIFYIDKQKAKRGSYRISENHLMLSAILGGSIGAFLAMKIFHHKTNHQKFAIGIPVILIIYIMVYIFVFKGGR